MTKSPEQLAEALARKCAFEQHKITCELEPHEDTSCTIFLNKRTETILQTIPLKELLECKFIIDKMVNFSADYGDCMRARNDLDTALKSILGEDGV